MRPGIAKFLAIMKLVVDLTLANALSRGERRVVAVVSVVPFSFPPTVTPLRSTG